MKNSSVSDIVEFSTNYYYDEVVFCGKPFLNLIRNTLKQFPKTPDIVLNTICSIFPNPKYKDIIDKYRIIL